MLIGGGHAGLMRKVSGSSSSSLIESIQQISITIPASGSSNTATITAVNTGTTVLIWGGTTGNDSLDFLNTKKKAIVSLTNSTTVTATRNTSDSSTVTVNLTVVEFKSSVVQSLQTGTILMQAASPKTATITSVDPDNSACFYYGVSSDDSNSRLDRGSVSVGLQDATHVRGYRVGFTNNATVGWAVLEFVPGILQSAAQHFDFYVGEASLTATSTITAVDPNYTMIAFGGTNSEANTPATRRMARVELTNSTTLTLTKETTDADSAIRVQGTVLEFKPQYIQSINRGTITISSGTGTATISAVNTAKTLVSSLGFSSTSGAQDFTRWPVNELTNSTTITVETPHGSSSNETAGYEAIEFV